MASFLAFFGLFLPFFIIFDQKSISKCAWFLWKKVKKTSIFDLFQKGHYK
jgi:hypothetical protein